MFTESVQDYQRTMAPDVLPSVGRAEEVDLVVRRAKGLPIRSPARREPRESPRLGRVRESWVQRLLGSRAHDRLRM